MRKEIQQSRNLDSKRCPVKAFGREYGALWASLPAKARGTFRDIGTGLKALALTMCSPGQGRRGERERSRGLLHDIAMQNLRRIGEIADRPGQDGRPRKK
jgi:hypothetical protein